MTQIMEFTPSLLVWSVHSYNAPIKMYFYNRLTSGRRHQSEDLGNVRVMSSKMNERVGAKKNNTKKNLVSRTASEPKKGNSVDGESQQTQEKEPQNAIFTQKAKERAIEVVKSLDLNRDGYVTQDEFITGCLEDGDFYHLISCFDAVIMLWGELMDTWKWHFNFEPIEFCSDFSAQVH